MRILIVFLLLATCAGAVPVDPNDPNEVAAVVEYGGSPWILRTNGEVWVVGALGWEYEPRYDIPFPVSDVCDWKRHILRDCNGDIWTWEYVTLDEGLWSLTPSYSRLCA